MNDLIDSHGNIIKLAPESRILIPSCPNSDQFFSVTVLMLLKASLTFGQYLRGYAVNKLTNKQA